MNNRERKQEISVLTRCTMALESHNYMLARYTMALESHNYMLKQDGSSNQCISIYTAIISLANI